MLPPSVTSLLQNHPLLLQTCIWMVKETLRDVLANIRQELNTSSGMGITEEPLLSNKQTNKQKNNPLGDVHKVIHHLRYIRKCIQILPSLISKLKNIK